MSHRIGIGGGKAGDSFQGPKNKSLMRGKAKYLLALSPDCPRKGILLFLKNSSAQA
jgi:hypothetical protein